MTEGALVVIPARLGSTRLPGKPLLRAGGKFLIQHVYERALLLRRAAEEEAEARERKAREEFEKLFRDLG